MFMVPLMEQLKVLCRIVEQRFRQNCSIKIDAEEKTKMM